MAVRWYFMRTIDSFEFHCWYSVMLFVVLTVVVVVVVVICCCVSLISGISIIAGVPSFE